MSACFSSSIAHGPPMSTSGCPPPTAIGPIWTSRGVCCSGVRVSGSNRGWPARDGSRLRALIAVEAGGHRALGHQDGIEAQAHGAALVGERPLLGEEIDHEVRGAGSELRRVGALQAAHGPCELDHRTLHAETDAEVGHALLARVAHRLDLALDAAVAEAPGHQDAVD